MEIVSGSGFLPQFQKYVYYWCIPYLNIRQKGAFRFPYDIPKLTESGKGQLQSTQSKDATAS